MAEQEWIMKPMSEQVARLFEQANYNIYSVLSNPVGKRGWLVGVRFIEDQPPLYFSPELADQLAIDAERNSQHESARILRAAAREVRSEE